MSDYSEEGSDASLDYSEEEYGSGSEGSEAENSSASASESESVKPKKKRKKVSNKQLAKILNVTEEKILRYREMFDSVDTDNRGDIEARELKRVMRMIGASAAASDVAAMIKLADNDIDGHIDFGEFCTILELANKYRFSQLYYSFKVFDENGDGTITKNEFEKVIKRLGLDVTNKERKAMLRKADRDHDGTLDLEEFLLVLGYKGQIYSEVELEELERLNEIDLGVSVEASEDMSADDEGSLDVDGKYVLVLQNFYLDDTHKIKTTAQTKVSDLIKKLAKRTGYPAENHTLYYNGFKMKPSDTLYKHGVSGVKPVWYIYSTPPGPLPSDQTWDSDGLPNLENIYKHFRAEGLLEQEDAFKIVELATEIMDEEDNLLHVPEDEDVIIVGDIHGQFYDLQEVFEAADLPFGEGHYVFLGDYVDRGVFSSECVLYLFAAKIRYPGHIHLLRGNHEAHGQNVSNGSIYEFKRKYGPDFHDVLVKAFYVLPLAATVTHTGHTFLCCHGGIAQEIPTVEDYNSIERKQEVPRAGGMKITLWSDPYKDNVCTKKNQPSPWPTSWNLADLEEETNEDTDVAEASSSVSDPGDYSYAPGAFHKSSRGKAVRTYGRAAVLHYLRENEITCIFRGHEQKKFGWEGYRRGPVYNFPSVMTVFSAPNYTDKSLNDGAIVRIRDGVLDVQTYKWRIHPQYFPCTKKKNEPHDHACEKNAGMDDFLQFVNWLHPEALSTMTVATLHKEYKMAFQVDIAEKGINHEDESDGAEKDWNLIAGNLNSVLKLSRDPKIREQYQRKSQAMLMWYQGYNHFDNAVEEESEYEMDDHHHYDPSDEGHCCIIL